MHGNIRNLNEPANFQVFKCELPCEAVNADTNGLCCLLRSIEQ
jgi:hypothetical protein